MSEKEKILYASVKPTVAILSLFERAKELDADGLGNPEILERGGHYLVNNRTKIDFKRITRKKNPENYTGTLPASFKVRINNSELYAEMINVIREAYNIKRVMTPFLIRVTLSAYIEHLENSVNGVTHQQGIKVLSDDIAALKLKAISLILNIEDRECLIHTIKSLEET